MTLLLNSRCLSGAAGSLLCAILLLELLVSLQGRRVNKQGVPLLGEEGNQRRKTKKTTDCHFGRKMYEIEDTWNPDLGPPFGVMYCVECECVPVQRKRRIVGKVKCRNVKLECPEPACDDPVLLTGKCCKTCPKEIPDWAQSEGVANRKLDPEDAEKSGHEYAALMVSDANALACQIQALASGRFALHRKNLHYTVQYVGPEPPAMIAFADEKGHIIEEHEVHVSPLHNSTYKVCGVWPKVPRVYRKALRQEGVFVHFVNPNCPEGLVGGQIARFYAVKTETFNTILMATPRVGGKEDRGGKGGLLPPARAVQGGMAIISTATSASANKAAHFLIVFKNFFLEKDGKDPMVSVRMESTQKEDNDNIIEEMVVLGKVTKDTVVAELKIDFDQKIFPVMARGKLLLSVALKHSPELRLSGLVVPKISCNVYHAVLSTADSLEEDVTPIGGVGQAVLSVENDGSLSYKIQIKGLTSPVTYVGLETQAKKAWKTVHNFTSTYEAGWANGTLPRLYIRDMELLTNEELYVNVGTERHASHLRGLVRQRLYGDAQNGDFPLLLTGSGTTAAGQAWISVDTSCRLYYEVVLGGLQQGGGNARKSGGGGGGGGGSGRRDADEVGFVELLDMSNGSLQAVSVVAGALGGNRELRSPQEFSGMEVDDIAEDLDKPAFARLDSGNAILHVAINSTSGGNTTRVDLQARINNLRVPVLCLDRTENTENEVQMTEECNQVDGGAESYHCVSEGRIIEDGEQWSHSRNSCLMCSCRRGRDICHPMICPTVTCPDARTLPGDCCPSCPTEDVNDPNRDNRGCYFEDRRYHIPGSSWHPYIPPFGFSQCVICNCNASTLLVSCKKITCQTLTCSEKEAYREHPTACCKVCPNPKPKPKTVNPGEYEDEGSEKDPAELLAEGGCKYRGQIMSNGAEWHPRVYPFGEMRCIKCYCKDGKTRCSRQKCSPLNCENKIVSRNECCPKCAADNVVPSKTQGHPNPKHKGRQNA